MKKYEGIILPIYRPLDSEKFQACPARPRGGVAKYELGVGERKDMKRVNTSTQANITKLGTREIQGHTTQPRKVFKRESLKLLSVSANAS